jgi:hypothetical protein
VDTCQLLDDLAVRRNHGRPPFPMPVDFSDLSVRFFEIDPVGRLKAGGLISLDGVHPTACGYALVAQEFINVMRAKSGEPIRDLDFASIRRWDTLVTAPPRTLDDMFGMLSTLDKKLHFSRWMSPTL